MTNTSETFEEALLSQPPPSGSTDIKYIHYFSPSPPSPGFDFRLGSCQEQKGLLPWRTLGLTEKGDSWGRQLGYWVDLAYSNRLLGFDEFSRADVSDPRRGYVAATLSGRQLLFYSSRQITSRSGVGHMNLAGGIVCSHLFKAGATGIDDADVGCPPARDKQTNLLAGIIHTHPSMVTLGARRIPAYAGADNQGNATGIVNGRGVCHFFARPKRVGRSECGVRQMLADSSRQRQFGGAGKRVLCGRASASCHRRPRLRGNHQQLAVGKPLCRLGRPATPSARARRPTAAMTL